LRAERAQRASESWIARTAYLPTLGARANFSSSAADTAHFLFEQFEARTTYELGLEWELFGGFGRERGTSQARAELRAAEEGLRAGELALEAQVRAGYLALLTAYATQGARAEDVELAGQELALAQERYRIGALSFPDLQESQLTFTAAETAYIRSAYGFFLALADLEEASGRPLLETLPAARTANPAPAPPAPASP
ncbi:MAG: TolC family protein, partial [Gemmatimonadetes bacterium]|nr:TolC family protein [Gemmatimonadota bacterium]